MVRRPVRERGLVGALYHPSGPGPYPGILALGGAGGGLSEGGARTIASEGFAAFALAYFGTDTLSKDLVEIPLEYFARAMGWMEEQPEVEAGRVVLVGNSKGGELALLLASTYPRYISGVVGYAASGIVWEGISLEEELFYGGPRSPWSLRGRPVPFAGFGWLGAPELVRMTEAYFEGCPISMRPLYERALRRGAAEAGGIAVEKMESPVLLISGTDDQLWPSTPLSEMVIRRLEAHGHPYPREHLRYEGAGHLIVPPGYEPNPTWGRRLELGGSPEPNRFANEDSWPRVLAFLNDRTRPGGG